MAPRLQTAKLWAPWVLQPQTIEVATFTVAHQTLHLPTALQVDLRAPTSESTLMAVVIMTSMARTLMETRGPRSLAAKLSLGITQRDATLVSRIRHITLSRVLVLPKTSEALRIVSDLCQHLVAGFTISIHLSIEIPKLSILFNTFLTL